MYHPILCEGCIRQLEMLIGFLLAIAIGKFGINAEEIIIRAEKASIDINSFPLIKNRL